MDVGVDEPGQEQAAAQVDDLLHRVGPGDLRDGAAAANHAVLHQDSRVVVGAQRAAGERALRGVEHRRAVDRHRDTSVCVEARSRSKVRTRSAATLTAMVAGSLPATSGSPMGVVIRASASGP